MKTGKGEINFKVKLHRYLGQLGIYDIDGFFSLLVASSHFRLILLYTRNALNWKTGLHIHPSVRRTCLLKEATFHSVIALGCSGIMKPTQCHKIEDT